MNILQSIFYGFMSGLSAFLPISLSGHQSFMNLLFGVSSPEPIRDLLVHISIALAVILSSRTYLEHLRYEWNRPVHRDRKARQEVSSYTYDIRLIKSSIIPMAILLVFLKMLNIGTDCFAILAVFFLLNGLILYMTEHMPRANKDGSQLSAFDGFLFGLSSALCMLPGLSRIAASMSCLSVRGADRNKAFQWSLALTIPMFVLFIIFDIIGLFAFGIGVIDFSIVIGYLLSAVFSFMATAGSIYLMRFLCTNSSFIFFALYSFAMALLSFILYLNT